MQAMVKKRGSVPVLPKVCGADIELGNFILGLPDGDAGDTRSGWSASRALLDEIPGVLQGDLSNAGVAGVAAGADAGSAGPDVVVTEVADDGVEPVREALRGPQRAQPPVGPDERLLGHVLRLVEIPYLGVSRAVDGVLVSIHKVPEGPGFSRQRAADQCRVGIC